MDRVADIDGPQRKILDAAVRPTRLAHGQVGIPLQDGVALPFVVERKWNAPAGHYPEQWFLIDSSTREILVDGPEQQILIWGLAAWTEVKNEHPGGFRLAPGTYTAVFALGGAIGGEFEVEAVEVTEAVA